MKNLIILKRLAFILEKTGLLDKYEFLITGFQPSTGYPALERLSSERGKHNSKYGLLTDREINVEKDHIDQ